MISTETTSVTNQQLAELRAEHRALDEKIISMGEQPYLSPEERLEMARLKKFKLRKKEQIYRLAQQLGIDP